MTIFSTCSAGVYSNRARTELTRAARKLVWATTVVGSCVSVDRDVGSGPRAARPLAGIRVLELGQLVAGPFCGHILAGLGAEVIKIEPPGEGDPLRRWRSAWDGTSLWWRALSRDKRSVTCDLRQSEGRELIARVLATGIDVVIENFRPGRMEAWGLGPAEVEAIDPRIVYVRISGYGQTGPLRDRPGFANVAEAFGGLRYTTGEAGRPSVRTGVSLGDSLAGLQAAMATLAALYTRETATSKGQVVDVALYESVFAMMESLIPEFDAHGIVRQATGGSLPGIVPSNTYRCSDGKDVVIGANADALFVKLMRIIGREDLASDPKLAHNDGRCRHAASIDAAISEYTNARPSDAVLETLIAASIPGGPIASAADIATDPQFAAREVLVPMRLPDGTTVRMPMPFPKLSRTPFAYRAVGPNLGADTDDVLERLLGLDAAGLAGLRARGII